MPRSEKRGPLPPEQASAAYAGGLHARLHCGSGWRADAFDVLRQEYARFRRAAASDEFGVLSMWEYARLVEATGGDWMGMDDEAFPDMMARSSGVSFDKSNDDDVCTIDFDDCCF